MVGLRANFHRSGGGGNTRGDVAFLKRGAHTKLSSREGHTLTFPQEKARGWGGVGGQVPVAFLKGW